MQMHFCSTLPRSGSTLIMNLMGQHPNLHVTPSSDLIEMVVGVRNSWTNQIGFKAEGLDLVQPRIVRMMRAMMRGFFEEEFEAGKAVLDKSRGWLAYIELLEVLLGRRVKVVCTVRPVEDILASFEKIHRKSVMTKQGIPSNHPAFADTETTVGRAKQLLSGDAVVGLSVSRLRDAIQRGVGDRLLVVPYAELTTRPKLVASRLAVDLGLPEFEFDPDNVQQITQEDDTVHGMKLHQIRSKIEPEKQPAWAGVLPKPFVKWVQSEYADINEMSQGRFRG